MASLGRTTADRLTTDSFSRVAGGLGLFAAIIYSAIPLQIVVHTNIGWIHGYVSDLGASDQPYAWMFQAIDGISGICVIVLAVAVYRRASATPLRVIGCGAVGLFGVSAVGDSLMPLECSSYLSAACKRAEDAGLLSWQHQGHLFSSIGTVVAVLASMVFLPLANRDLPGWERMGRWWWPGAALLIAVALLCGVWEVWQLADGPGGVAQRAMLLLMCAWVAHLSVLVLRPPLDDRPGAGERSLVATRA